MPYLLNVLYGLLLLACAPWLAHRAWAKGKYRAGWAEKLLGKAPRRVSQRPCLWFHAVSVGEVNLLRPLVAELARRRPGWEVVISTTTWAGLSVARRTFPDLVTFYAPLDFTWAVRRAVAKIRPTVLALVELELWPNLIWAARRAGVKVAVLNGRLGARSHRGYRRVRPFLRRMFRGLDLVAAQTPEYAARFLDLGSDPGVTHVTGSIKYDGLESERDNPRTLQLRRELGLDPADVVFVAGSTMEGEEAAALAAYRSARRRHPRLRLIVVPRHPERFGSVAAALERAGVRVVRRSQGVAPRESAGGEPAVILVDTLGELGAVWGIADIAFVGGSLFPGRGGQNMMEPAAYGASVLFGPYTHNFRDAVEGLLACGGARRVADAEELARAVIEDLDDPEAASARGAAGRTFVLAQNGAAERTLALLDPLVEPRAAAERRAVMAPGAPGLSLSQVH